MRVKPEWTNWYLPVLPKGNRSRLSHFLCLCWNTVVMKKMMHCVILSGRMARRISSCCRGNNLCVRAGGGRGRRGEEGWKNNAVEFPTGFFTLFTSLTLTPSSSSLSIICISLQSPSLHPPSHLYPMPSATLMVPGAAPSPTILHTVSFPSLPNRSRISWNQAK